MKISWLTVVQARKNIFTEWKPCSFIAFDHILYVIFFLIYQVTVEYKYDKGACVPVRVHTVVISIQHDEKVTLEQLRKELMEKVIKPVIPAKLLDDKTVFHLQPSGKFIIGGPQVCFLCFLIILIQIQ